MSVVAIILWCFKLIKAVVSYDPHDNSASLGQTAFWPPYRWHDQCRDWVAHPCFLVMQQWHQEQDPCFLSPSPVYFFPLTRPAPSMESSSWDLTYSPGGQGGASRIRLPYNYFWWIGGIVVCWGALFRMHQPHLHMSIPGGGKLGRASLLWLWTLLSPPMPCHRPSRALLGPVGSQQRDWKRNWGDGGRVGGKFWAISLQTWRKGNDDLPRSQLLNIPGLNFYHNGPWNVQMEYTGDSWLLPLGHWAKGILALFLLSTWRLLSLAHAGYMLM